MDRTEHTEHGVYIWCSVFFCYSPCWNLGKWENGRSGNIDGSEVSLTSHSHTVFFVLDLICLAYEMYLIILTNYNVDTYDTNCAFSPAINKNNDLHSVSMETVW